MWHKFCQKDWQFDEKGHLKTKLNLNRDFNSNVRVGQNLIPLQDFVFKSSRMSKCNGTHLTSLDHLFSLLEVTKGLWQIDH